MSTLIYHFIKKNASIVAACGIFASIVIILGLPFTEWGFLLDDFGVIWHVRKGLADIFSFFTEPSIVRVFQPSNYQLPEQTFFSVFYRPFSCIFFASQYHLFGFSAYGYFLTTIMLHAFNAVLFFFLMTPFIPLIPALLAALFWGFHISYYNWLGWIAGQEHIVNFTLILLLLHVLKKYFDSGKILFFVATLVTFAISLFTRETAIFFPCWIPWVIDFYQSEYKPRLNSLYYNLIVTGSLFIITMSYLALRISLYPLKTSSNIDGLGKLIHDPGAFFYSLQSRFFDAVTFLADLANLSCVGGGHRLLKGSLLMLFLITLFILFSFCKRKKPFLFFIMSGFVFLWPPILRYYVPRYLYKALAFFILAGVTLIAYYKSTQANFSSRLAHIIGYLTAIVIIINAFFLVKHFHRREQQEQYRVAQAFRKLAKNNAIKKQNVCFIALPYHLLGLGTTQALWISGHDEHLPVYSDLATFIYYDVIPTKNDVSIKQTNDSLRLTSHNPEHVWLGKINKLTQMGTIQVHQRNSAEHPTDMTYTFGPWWRDKNLFLITWDFETNNFAIL